MATDSISSRDTSRPVCRSRGFGLAVAATLACDTFDAARANGLSWLPVALGQRQAAGVQAASTGLYESRQDQQFPRLAHPMRRKDYRAQARPHTGQTSRKARDQLPYYHFKSRNFENSAPDRLP